MLIEGDAILFFKIFKILNMTKQFYYHRILWWVTDNLIDYFWHLKSLTDSPLFWQMLAKSMEMLFWFTFVLPLISVVVTCTMHSQSASGQSNSVRSIFASWVLCGWSEVLELFGCCSNSIHCYGLCHIAPALPIYALHYSRSLMFKVLFVYACRHLLG